VRADLGRLAAGLLTPDQQQSPEERIPLIGRDAERKELLQRLDEALAGRGSMVMIGGEPGIGKTHLVTAILEEARRRGAYTNIGHCYEMEGSPPYVPFIEMLEHTARVAPKRGLPPVLGRRGAGNRETDAGTAADVSRYPARDRTAARTAAPFLV